MAKKGNSLKSGDRRPFICLQLDIVGHSRLMAPDRDLHKAKELFHQETGRIAEANGGFQLKWEGDGGAFLFPVTDDSEFDKACQAAFAIFDSLPEVNQKIKKETALVQPLRVRVSVDYGEVIYDLNPGLITSDFLNAFLKHEREIAQSGTVTVTERVFKQLALPLQARFAKVKFSSEVGSQLYRSVEEDQERVMIWLDSSRDAFIRHLVSHDAIWIVGITNEHLADHLRNAFEQRNERAWNEIRVLFQARHLVEHFREGGAERGPGWERGVKETIDFFLKPGPQKSKKLDIRHVNRILPFVGQFYDYYHVRVAFVLPVPDIQTSCYLNCRGASPGRSNSPPLPPPTRDEAAEQFEAVQYAFEHLRNVSTPLLTSNIVGRRAADESFQFESLMPQDNWRHSSTVFGGRPAHLVTFVLLYNETHLFLQYRDETNSNGQQNKFGVLPGKVNDEDFFEAAPPEGYWHEIYEMQKTFDALAPGARDSATAKAARQRASAALSSATQIQLGASIPAARLVAVCRRAAARYLDEKLGLSVAETRLHSVRERHYFVEKPDYSLYAQLYALRLKTDEMNRIEIRRPFANLKQTDLGEFRTLRAEGKLTLFLEQHFDEIMVFLRAQLGGP